MPRNRMIRPEFWDDEKLADISFLARLTYIGIWTFSDDYGVVKGNAKWLKNKIFPYDNLLLEEYQRALDELMSLNRLLPFNNNGECYYFIPKFLKYQKIDRPSKTMKNPDPPKNIESSKSNQRALDDEVKLSKAKLKEKRYIVSDFPREIQKLYEYFISTFDNSEKQFIPKTEKQKYEWFDCLDKCNKIDNYTYEQIRDMMEYVRDPEWDDFWYKVFKTPLKFRRKNKEGLKYIDIIWNKIEDEVEYEKR